MRSFGGCIPSLHRKHAFIANLGVWDGLCWNWSLVWRRDFFEWEITSFNELQNVLAQVSLVRDVADKAVWMHHNSGSYNVKIF